EMKMHEQYLRCVVRALSMSGMTQGPRAAPLLELYLGLVSSVVGAFYFLLLARHTMGSLSQQLPASTSGVVVGGGGSRSSRARAADEEYAVSSSSTGCNTAVGSEPTTSGRCSDGAGMLMPTPTMS
ncbi:unnamed protein product, partial [Notodromas monacha]